MLQIEKKAEDSRLTFKVSGRLDTNTAPELEDEIRKNLSAHIKEMTLDLEGLTYISSAGLRVLLVTHKAMMNQGRLEVVHVNEAVMDVLDLTGFSGILNIL